MSINRYELVSRHNPVLTVADVTSPLSVGNGNFAYTADITGMQTLRGLYEGTLPLCTMTQWGWHTKPAGAGRCAYSPEDVEMTEYPFQGRKVFYAVEKKKGNEEIYDWLRENPHRLNLAGIGLRMPEKSSVISGSGAEGAGEGDRAERAEETVAVKDTAEKASDTVCGEIRPERIGDIRQELHLYEGILESRFTIDGIACEIMTAAHSETDTAAFRIRSEAFRSGLEVGISFPYGSPGISASDWTAEEAHGTEIVRQDDNMLLLKRILDRDVYYVAVRTEGFRACRCGRHYFRLMPLAEEAGFTVSFLRGPGADGQEIFAEDIGERVKELTVGKVMDDSRQYWRSFWEKGGAVDLHESTDPRAFELERRIVLSQYLLAIQSAGDVPPQETGLTCNSWYGKFHLEMYLWHEAWLPLWNHGALLERSLAWYKEHLPEARANAARNGFKGARWPKMVAADAEDSPSRIAVLLIWQQPHIIWMLKAACRNCKETAFLEKYFDLVEETAEFMADFTVYNEERQVYELLGPVIPVQECHDPTMTKNPAFEVEYWSLGLRIACEWAERLKGEAPEKWKAVAERMAPMAVGEGKYLAHDNCPDTYRNFNRDHPSMLCSCGLIDSGRIDREVMRNSLKEAERCWDYSSLWGWDFAVMCMTAVRLGEPEHAVELLLKETAKNSYVTSGNNFQRGRSDLPLYLPGNGSLLLAVALMTAGYPGSGELPGFPKDGQWKVEYEGIDPFPC